MEVSRDEGRRAYELATLAVALFSRDFDVRAEKAGLPGIDDQAESLQPGGSLKYIYDHPMQLQIMLVLERRAADFVWHVVVNNSLGASVLDVVYDTSPSASECEVLRYSPGRWEQRLSR